MKNLKFNLLMVLVLSMLVTCMFSNTTLAAELTGFTFSVDFQDVNNTPESLTGYKVLISTEQGIFSLDNALEVNVNNEWVTTIPTGAIMPLTARVSQAYVEGNFYIGYTAVDLTGVRHGPICVAGSVTLPSGLSSCSQINNFAPIYDIQ